MKPLPTLLGIALVAGSLLFSGCVSRSFTIDSAPPGAEVYVGGREFGVTPVTRSFTYYGPRRILLRKEGYRILEAVAELRPPGYERCPLDLLAEHLYPGHLRDARQFHYELVPLPAGPGPEEARQALVSRGEEGRARLREVPADAFQVAPRKNRAGHGSFPYRARERQWWHQR